ncbi:M28 family peptidase [Flavobacterium psychrophilum]|uniref:M28 family metallopeptidase n=1 Tax=Flavobacterium psychrophilum TaxID=96345 RepID=UPI000B7C4BB7|nr:M28 family metallopeptidase [Flavobacterium psychrophilum]EKT4499493.1 M28 family peptidase [Flavobacterium psychrophilum]ELM3651096.1 M28 family peptidase [Flavobacterium psychrophilum]ELM3672257.1 M28 family peptidase [Flavobacterium psychrophilum]ELM3726780.1 M28 family peptidase [Flavobacterium psychrophilum]ELY1978997.1 M28 family peptidase [Flavobacterium psychrophilum]
MKYKNPFLVLVLITITSCSAQKARKTEVVTDATKYIKTITTQDLKTHLTIVASDKMEGRNTGSKGQKEAGNYLIDTYKSNGISFPKGAENFYQKVPASFMNKDFGEKLPDSENIWAYIEGSEKPNEILVISAHYDHIGIKNGEIYNGADDDGSGTVALLEIAQAFQQAKNEGHGPKRSILFLHVTGEEYGLHGSRYYTENPLFPIANTIANINIDMIGRRDDFHKKSNNYIYLIGSDYLSTNLYKVCEQANKKYTNITLDYKFNDRNDPNRYYYRSDHYNFAKNNIPSVFLFNGVHADYHQASDEINKIEFDALAKRTQLAFSIAWQLANQKQRPKVDKPGN